MAKKKVTKAAKKKKKTSTASSKKVESYEHQGSKRLNNPQVGLVNTKTAKQEKIKKYNFDPHLEPELQWAGKFERNSFELPSTSLHIHERVDPKTIIDAVRSKKYLNWEQLNLFNKPINKLDFVKEIQFYQHEKDWTNRLISGDSLMVMNSLLDRENMHGKLQMVYIDPPYGVKYGSNFQPFVNNRGVTDKKDTDLSQEPEVIKAFRDTWELGIHSYLSHLRERLLLSKDLLNESGSVFVQISDENVHHVREIMDEIFGAKNFYSMIVYQKTGGLARGTLPTICDFVLWYCKDKKKAKLRTLYQKKVLGDVSKAITPWFVEMPDGTFRPLSKDEKKDPSIVREGRIFRPGPLKSEGASKSSFDYTFDGESFPVGANKHWKISHESLDRVANAGRIFKLGNTIHWKYFVDDYPVSPFTNVWTDTQQGGFSDQRLYVVQTGTKVVERCMLMCTDPGDMVFDPTCGSGTTALVAEKWGRKWITCDTSRVAIALAKQRIMTSTFDYYSLQYPEEGVSSGFIYKKVPHITLSSVGNNRKLDNPTNRDIAEKYIREGAPQETLFDDPIVDKEKARVSGPFTVEAVPAPTVKSIYNESSVFAEIMNSPADWVEELRVSGIRLKNNQTLKLARLELCPGTRWIHADGETAEEQPQRIVVSFGPNYAPLEQKQVELALQEAEKLKPSPTVVAFASFQFDPEAAKDIDEIDWTGVSILKVQMNTDLFTDDLKKKRSSNESFWLVGQPDVEIKNSKKEKSNFEISVNGFDYYNTKTGKVESGGANKIAMWMLDTDYDGRSLLPSQVFFPMAGKKDGWHKLSKALKAEIDQELIEKYRGTISLPFEAGEHKRCAVKIIDDRGIESFIVKDLV